MDEQMIALARRAVACKGWRWMSGMLDTSGGRFICYADCGEAAWVRRADDGCEWLPVAERLPDLTDPATLGCLLALVREAWNDPGIACVTSSYINGRYHRRVVDGHHHGSTFQTMSQATYSTEAEALVAALEASPTE